jgi:hypothetical protein
MNKLTKVGVSALAGSLASFAAANAVEMTASGSAKLTYIQGDSTEVTGNPMGMNTSVAFSGSGEVNGYATTLMVTAADQFGGMSSAALTVDLGDLGTIHFDQGVGKGGLSTIDDKTPTANEEVWDGLDAVVGANDGRVGMGNSGAFVYANTFAGLSFTGQFAKGGSAANTDDATAEGTSGTSYDFALTGSGDDYGIAGLAFGGVYGKIANGSQTLAADHDTDMHATAFVNYSMGMVTAGIQQSTIQRGRVSKLDEKTQAWGISANINDNLSMSYGERETTYHRFTEATAGTNVVEDIDGFAVAYTMGSAKITLQQNETSNNGGVNLTNDEHTQVALSLSF